MKKTNKKRILSLLLVGVLFASVGTISKAGTAYSYDFFMNGKGGADRSNDRKKSESGKAYVKISSIATSAAPTMLLTMRVRLSQNDAKATETSNFAKTDRGGRYLSYRSGYGSRNKNYYLKMQTNSNASQCAWVDGTWRP